MVKEEEEVKEKVKEEEEVKEVVEEEQCDMATS